MSAVRGPVEVALDRVVRRAIGGDGPLPPGAEVEWVRRHRTGEFRLDVRPLLGTAWPSLADVDVVLDALRALPEIQGATFAPPRVFMTVSLGFLAHAVLGGAWDAGTGYGSSHGGAGRTASVTFSDPNVNKPLHVGHLRNNVLGISVARLLENDGWAVRRSELCSDWGLHICRALVGYVHWGHGATPETAGVPGDVLVGEFYVRFHREAMKQLRGARSALPGRPLEEQAADVLRRLELGEDPELAALLVRLTGWVRAGNDATYERIGCRFEGHFSERANLAVGRDLVERGLASGACDVRDDGSVYVDLSGAGHADYSRLTLRRPDGTLLVYARAFGALVERHRAHPADRVVEVLGADWETAYPAFLEALARLGEPWARDIELVFHGMVRMANDRMSSRDGLVVSARELLDRCAAGVAERWALTGDVADALGVALAKHHLLSLRRDRELVFDEDRLWSGGFPRFTALLGTVALARRAADRLRAGSEPVAPTPGPRGDEGAAAWRHLLHCLDAFPRAVGFATRDLEPNVIARYLDDLCAAVGQARESCELGPAWCAVDVALSRGLWLLGIDLPAVELWSEPVGRPVAQSERSVLA